MPRSGTVVNRPPLVILHGLFGSKQNWRSLGKAFAQRLQAPVYALDLPHHGTSPWPIASSRPPLRELSDSVRHFMDSEESMLRDCELAGGKYWLMGHSLGGRVSMLMALLGHQHPISSTSIDKLVVVDMPPRPPSLSSGTSKFPRYVQAMLDLERQHPNATKKQADAILAAVESDLSIRQFLLTNWVEQPNGRMGFRVNLGWVQQSLHGFGEWLEQHETDVTTQVSTLFVYGTRSDYVKPDRDMDLIKKHFPNNQLAALPTGHWVHAEAPQDFVTTVSDFLLKDD